MNKLVLIALCFVAGCATLKDASLNISPGDSKDRVLAAMGPPEDRQFQGRQEAWQYGAIATIGICEYTTIWFNAGVVTGLNSYRNKSMTGCRAGMKSIQWEQAPDTIIEVRNR